MIESEGQPDGSRPAEHPGGSDGSGAPAQRAATQDVAAALDRFVQASLARYGEFTDPFDREWRSPCETGAPRLAASGELEVPWRPLRRPAQDAETLFAPLERALELDVHPDLRAYYGRYYAGGLEADSPDGPVSLLQLWNEDDTVRLIENLLGHAIAKQRARAPYSIFFACTAVDSDLFLAVENHTGHVLLERPGYPPEQTVAPNLAEFLDRLTPAPPERHPERAAFLAHRGGSAAPHRG